MSDLIRRKDVAEFMFNNRMCTSINNAYDKLKCIPTAHDPKTVVKQLEEVSYERLENNGMGGELVVNLDDAAEIVKGGGVDGN